jgi:hypothetical protein
MGGKFGTSSNIMDSARCPPPRLWRSIKKERSPSIDQPTDCKEGWTFDLKAPIVDFFGRDYITQFAPLEEILEGKADEIMNKAYRHDEPGEDYTPFTAGGYNFRWIHIPANNMAWVEVCYSCFSVVRRHSELTMRLVGNHKESL